MKILFLRQWVIVLLTSSCSVVVGQNEDHLKESRFRPFSILIVTPDSATIDDSLKPLIDTVELEYKEGYYSYIRTLEIWKRLESEKKERETEMKIQRAKWMEMEIHDFKYYQTISMLSCPELLSLFNEYPWEKPSLTCDLIETRDLFTYDLKKLSVHYGFDYIVTYNGIYAENKDNKPVLRLITSIYSKKENKIIHENETYGHNGFYKNKYGDVMKCSNDLQCLLETGVKSSTEDIFRVISKRQKK